MSGKRRSPAQVTRDRRRIADLYLRGWLQADIAAELKIDQSTVSRDLSALQEEWRQSTLVDLNEAKSKELAKVDQLEREYWEAWERSKENAEVEVTEQIGTRRKLKQGEKDTGEPAIVPERLKKYKRVEGQSGNPSFLAGIQWCINKRCEILGLNAPKNVDLTSGGEKIQQPITVIEVVKDYGDKRGE